MHPMHAYYRYTTARLFASFGECFQTAGADERTLARTQNPCPLQVGLLFPAFGRVIVAAEKFPGAAHQI